MNEQDRDRMKKLLQQALPPVEGDAGPERDLWPGMLRRMDAEKAAMPLTGWACFNGAWFDVALLAGVVGLVAIFPAAVPVLLYYL
jgi:hypothetical protein